MRARREQAALRAICLILGGALLAVSWLAGGPDSPLGYLLPVAIAFAPLLAGRYLGEESLARMRRRASARRRPARGAPSLPRRIFQPLARGGALLAGPNAARPPPRPAG